MWGEWGGMGLGPHGGDLYAMGINLWKCVSGAAEGNLQPPEPGGWMAERMEAIWILMWPSLSSISINDMLIKGKQWDRLPAPVTLCGCWECQAVILGLHLETCLLIRSALCRQCRQVLPRLGHAPFPSPETLLSRPPDRQHEMHKLTAPSCWAAAACGESRKSSCHPGCSDKATGSFLCWCPIIANARQLDGLGGFRLGSWCTLATELAVAVFMQIIFVQSKHLEKAKAPGSDIWRFFPLMKQKNQKWYSAFENYSSSSMRRAKTLLDLLLESFSGNAQDCICKHLSMVNGTSLSNSDELLILQ